MTLRRVFNVLLLADLFSMAVRHTLDPDLWWHLKTGELIWKAGIPHQDVFSFTVRGHLWIAHEWLSDVFMWALYQAGGLAALSLIFATLTAWAFWLVYRCCAGQPYLAGLVVILGTFTAAPTFGARPQTFNILFTAAFVHIVEGYKSQRLARRALLFLPLLTVVWANVHSGYILGAFLLATWAVGETLERLFPRTGGVGASGSDARTFGILAVACFLAAVVNPNGWHIWTFAITTLGSPVIQENIREWHSPDFHMYIYWPFAAMMALGVVGWVYDKSRPGWTSLLLSLGTAAGGLVSTRHIPFFALVTAPILARALSQSIEGTAASARLDAAGVAERRSRPATATNWLLLLVGVLAAGAWAKSKLSGNDAAIAETFPVEAVDSLIKDGLAEARGYNTYQWGGYLIWRGVPVFIDGRAEVYGNEFLSYYLKTFRLQADWRAPLDDFNVAYVLVETSNPLATLLATSSEWRQVYADSVARIFKRANAAEPTRLRR